MKKYVAFLRAINVGGHHVLMDALCTLFQEAGLSEVQTFLASGNVVFTTVQDTTGLEERLEQLFSVKFGFESKMMIRGLDGIQKIYEYAAFPAEEIRQAGAYNVAFLKQVLSIDAERQLLAMQNETDRFHVNGSTVYWLCSVKQSQSKFSNHVLEKTIQIPSTLRGISTIDKLIKKYS